MIRTAARKWYEVKAEQPVIFDFEEKSASFNSHVSCFFLSLSRFFAKAGRRSFA
jgi:hypothetical protein